MLDEKFRKNDDDMNIAFFTTNNKNCILERVDRFDHEGTMKSNKHSSWITNEIKNCIKNSDNLFQSWLKDPTNDSQVVLKHAGNDPSRRPAHGTKI